jgi:arginase
VPTSAGAFAPGQERAPEALREAGLLDSLRRSGIEVRDHGDREPWRWRPDRENRRAQNAGKVVEIVRDTARRVGESIGEGEVTLVLGGDCTVGIGTVAGHAGASESLCLVYFDAHADLNVPESVPEGALDWMGMAHMLGERGAVPELVDAGPQAPLLEPGQILIFGWDPDQATKREREAIGRLGISTVAVDEVTADPQAAASRARELAEARADRVLVHFDVDVIDFTDAPLSENQGQNKGLPYQVAIRALDVLLGSPKLAALTITELNPDHAAAEPGAVERLGTDVAAGLARALGEPAGQRGDGNR